MTRDLDRAYAEADAFDGAQFDKWVVRKFERFTKRTDYPKLGWLIHQLNEAGVASIVHGWSFHAPVLWVEKAKLDLAWLILDARTDEIDDDDPAFAPFADVQPDSDLY